MKTIITSFFLLAVGILNAQHPSDYKYVIVPNTFNDFVKDDYKMNLLLKTNLRKKNYEIIADGSSNFPDEVKNNQCLATKADIKNIKSAFQNKLNIVFLDCNNNVISEYEGSSKIKDFEKGYQEALNNALKSLPLSNPKSNNLTVKDVDNKINLLNPPSTITLYKADSTKNIESEVMYYLNGATYILNKIGKNYNLIDKVTGKTVIQFFPTSKDKVYHALIESYKRNYQSVAFFNDNTIEVEYQKDQNIWEVKTYTK